MAKKAKSAESASPAFIDTSMLYGNMLDEIERQVHITSGLEADSSPMSTNLLAMDLMMGGGIRPAMYTTAGDEQSTKTTSTIQILAAAVVAGVPIKSFFDYEGSSGQSLPYIESIFRANGIKISAQDLFGVRDKKTGKYVVNPIVRYQPEKILEKFFDYVHGLIMRLPDKRLLGGDWWYIYEDNTANKAKYGEYGDSSMPKKYGKGIYIPAPDGLLQAIVVTDSWAKMNPKANDEEESDNSLALQARAFSHHLKRVVGSLSAKRIALVGVNQLSDIPMARYGPTQQEKGGKSLRYDSSFRAWNSSRAISGQPLGTPKNTEGRYEFEKSVTVEDGVDKYRYIHQKMVKNKLSAEVPEVWYRLWVKDGNGIAQGYDPVYDTAYYLWATGQLQIAGTAGRKSMPFNLHGVECTGVTLSWANLKRWVLGNKDEKRAVCEKLGIKPIDIRKYCFKQMRDGVGMELYEKHAKKSKKASDD